MGLPIPSDIGQISGMAGFFTALSVVLRIAERRLLKDSHVALPSRTTHLEGRVDELEFQVSKLRRADLPERLDEVEANVRHLQRNAQ